MHPDGYIQLKDRSKDIIISGGENISSIEVEDALYKHPAVQAAAVVAKPDDKWGETPCAFVELKPGQSASARRTGRLVQEEPRRLQMPAPRGVRRTAEDHHGEDPEVQAARDGEGGVKDAPTRPQRPPKSTELGGAVTRSKSRRVAPTPEEPKLGPMPEPKLESCCTPN